MRIAHLTSALVASLFALPLALTACGGDDGGMDAEVFKTLQACFSEHTEEENMPVQEAVVVCCIDHPIGDTTKGEDPVHPSCGLSVADCKSHVAINITGLSEADLDAACQSYAQNLAE